MTEHKRKQKMAGEAEGTQMNANLKQNFLKIGKIQVNMLVTI